MDGDDSGYNCVNIGLLSSADQDSIEAGHRSIAFATGNYPPVSIKEKVLCGVLLTIPFLLFFF